MERIAKRRTALFEEIYCKETEAGENTVRFWQEIYDRNGKLVAKHEKFPFDSGHKNV